MRELGRMGRERQTDKHRNKDRDMDRDIDRGELVGERRTDKNRNIDRDMDRQRTGKNGSGRDKETNMGT